MGRGSKRKRRKKKMALAQPQGHSQKSVTPGGWTDWSSWYGTTSNNVDLMRTKWGAASAYAQVHQITICTTILVNALAGLRWEIVDYNNVDLATDPQAEGKVVSSSDELFPTHPLTLAMNNFRRENGTSLISTIMFDRTLYGEVFIEKSMELGKRILNWLNPLGVTVEHHLKQNVLGQQEEVIQFRYGWGQIYEMIEAPKVAYMHTRNPLDDYTGYSRVLAVMAKINIERNLDTFFRDFFANNAIPAMIISPTQDRGELSPQSQSNVEKKLRNQIKGLGNQFRALVMESAMEFTTLDNPDVGKQYGMTEGVSTAIFEGMGVPQAMAGNVSGLSAFQTDNGQAMRNFFFGTILPEAREIEQYINTELLPFFGTGERVVFRFDTSSFDEVTEADQLEATIVNSQLDGGYLSYALAAGIQERPVEEWMEDRFKVEGVPMTPTQIDQLVEAKIAAAIPQPMFFGGNGASEPADPPALPTDDVLGISGEPGSEEANAEFFGDEDEESKTFKSIVLATLIDVDQGDCDCESEPINHLEWDNFQYEQRQKSELIAWYRFKKAHVTGKSKATRRFQHKVIPPWMKYAVIDRMQDADSLDEFRKAFDYKLLTALPHVKAADEFERAMRDNVRALWKRNISRPQFIRRMEEVIDVEYRDEFVRALEDNGSDFGGLDDDQKDAIVDLIDDEQGFIAAFADAIIKNREDDDGKLAPMLRRLASWAARFVAVASLAKIIAKRDKRLIWNWDPAKEHCIDCRHLNGKVKTGKQWKSFGVMPRSSKLNCFGVHCGCSLDDTKLPVSRGRLPILVGPT